MLFIFFFFVFHKRLVAATASTSILFEIIPTEVHAFKWIEVAVQDISAEDIIQLLSEAFRCLCFV